MSSVEAKAFEEVGKENKNSSKTVLFKTKEKEDRINNLIVSFFEATSKNRKQKQNKPENDERLNTKN
jgi:hypothetical protein